MQKLATYVLSAKQSNTNVDWVKIDKLEYGNIALTHEVLINGKIELY